MYPRGPAVGLSGRSMPAAPRHPQRPGIPGRRATGPGPSTVGRVLRRHHMPHLAAITGQPVRRQHSTTRYQRHAPGELPHVDVKKLARVPEGWRVHGRGEAVRGRGIGHDYPHVAMDDHSGWPTSRRCPTNETPLSPGSSTAR